MGVSTTELEKAIKSLEEALDLHQNSRTEAEKKAFRDAVIQRFEFSIELSWKTAMKVLGSTAAAPKPAIREMARNNLINDPESWFKFIDARNETSHTYDEDVAQKVYLVVLEFLPFGKELLVKLKSMAS